MSDLYIEFDLSYKKDHTLIFVETEIVYALSNRKTIVDPASELRVAYVFDLNTDSGILRIPVQSFQSRLKDDGFSYLDVYIPAGTQYIGIAKIGQKMSIKRVVTFTDGSNIESEITVSTSTSVTPTLSANNSTMTISGSYQYPANNNPKSIALTAIQYVAYYNSTINIRSQPNSQLQPGDVISYGGLDYTASEITMFVDSTSSYLEVSGDPR